ncbi:M1 family aminopeptidase [Aquimarina macrocephali]|uniref:M1 family aminopeptidase n=1 Tax=Aquimarina macrocephali TaxID=666563 RepID=UPI0004BB15A4|nr:M1 family aminopeptidase [Aquimarina macrocephali]
MLSKRIKKQLLIIIVILNSVTLTSQTIKHYEGNIHIDMDKREVIADFTISLDDLSDIDQLKLYIHRSANSLKASSNSKVIPFQILEESFVGEDKAVLIQSKGINNKQLTLKYAYSLDSIQDKRFLYNKDWLELNLYTAWFPFNLDYGFFSYNLNIELPNTYKLIGSGTVSNKENIWEIKQNIPFLDIPLIISSKLKTIIVAKGKIKIHHLNLDSSSTKALKKSLQLYHNRLNKVLGESNAASLTIAVNRFNRSTSYARKEFISLSIKDSFGVANDKILAHEIAHLWWNKADVNTWEDWLNESFAEYSSVILQRHQYGEANFSKNIEELKKTIKNLPPIYQIKKSNAKYQQVVTYKGAYLLYELENLIGRKAFSTILEKTHQNKIRRTFDLLELIEAEFGSDVKGDVNKKLRE